MNALLDHITLHDRFCPHHGQYCNYVGIESGALAMRVACHHCLASSPRSGGLKVMSVERFRDYLGAVVRREDERQHRVAGPEVSKVIAARKRDFEQKQFQVLEQVIRKLSDEKDALFTELERVEKAYLQGEEKRKFNAEQRKQMAAYLREFALDEQLLRLKLLVSNDLGLGSFIAQVRSLDILAGQHDKNNRNEAIEQIERKFRSQAQCSILPRLQDLLKITTAQPKISLLELQSIGSRQATPRRNRSQQNIQYTQRRNQSHQKIQTKSPRTSRHSFAQLPRMIL